MWRSIGALVSAVFCGFSAQADEAKDHHSTAYDFSFTSISGQPMPLSAFKGKVLLVVNTASECGFTGQYEGLQALYAEKKEAGLVVIGVPSNDFGGQEPGSEEEIKNFCESKFNVTFPLTSKNTVIGEDAHPFYKWIRSQTGWTGAPKWNFHKYVIGRDGALLDSFSSMTGPDSEILAVTIDNALSVEGATENKDTAQ